ncbi:MAG: sensor histidine kinase N-terminal domain-containing protein [Gammaproteobacteria bacterium]|nr:sensor histidine kinase N-terminal domain-containing protein [Gammaproteobacteria bacterium]
MVGKSLRRRLLVVLLTTTLGTWSVVFLATVHVVRDRVAAVYDANLSTAARVLASLVSHELSEELDTLSIDADEDLSVPLDALETELEAELADNAYQSGIAYQFAVAGRQLRFASYNAPAMPLAGEQEGFSDSIVDGEPWRVFTLRARDAPLIVHVGERQRVRGTVVAQIQRELVLPLAAGLPVLGLLVWFGVTRSLEPLNRLARAILQRDPARLDPLPVRSVAVEVRPLVDNINRLFDRLRRVIDAERNFTADAAHELRTPLAGIKTQTQLATRTRDAHTREHALAQIERGVDRATRLVEQLLTLARFDPDSTPLQSVEIDPGDVLQTIVAELRPLAKAKGITLQMDVRERAWIRADRNALAILSRNLLDNAVRYTPKGGTVETGVSTGGGLVTLHVADSGPGVPAQERERVFDRFYRHTRQLPGSGLGLSIVRRIAALEGAEIRLGTATLGGLLVELRFAAAGASS